MVLRYIMGLPGSGKTDKCLREIMRQPGKKAFYLVPEQYSMQSERDIARKSPGGVAMAQVVSFKRLAFRLFSRAGAPRGAFLDDVGKVMLLRKITADLRGSLSFYGRSADKQGFIVGLSNTIAEFYQYGVKHEDLQKAAQAAPDGFIKAKLHDLYLIFERYAHILGGGYFSMEEALDFLPGKIDETGELDGADIWVDGFHGFTLQERRVLSKAIRKAGSVTVAITVNEKAVSYPRLRPYDFFYETKRAVNQITALAMECGAKVEPPEFLARNGSQPLDFFRRGYFWAAPRVYAAPAPEISLLAHHDREAEVESAAAEITALLRDKGYRYRDIAVLTGDINAYEKKIERIFNLWGIPFFIDIRVDITPHPLVELIRAAVETAAKRMAYEGVFRFLRTGMTGIPRGEVDALENFVLGYGVKGYQWGREWSFGEGAERANAARALVVDALSPLISGLPARKAPIREYCARIFKMLERLKVNEIIDKWAQDMQSEGDNEMARRHSQIWGKVCAVFDKLVETLGDSPVSVSEFGKILDAGFAACDMGIIPPSVDQVVVGDVTRSRMPGVKALIVLGANEGSLPKPAPDTGFLNDEERQFLMDRGIETGSDGKRRNGEDRFLAYAAMSKPSETLSVSYSRFDGGKELKPAACVESMAKMFPNARVAAHSGIPPAKPTLGRMGLLMRRHMGGDPMPAEMLDVYGLLKSHAAYGPRLSGIENALKQPGAGGKLSERNVRRMYGRDLVSSISRLERYAECPFAYFMAYNLKARERRLYTIGNLDTGNMFHGVLEEFAKKLSSAGESWRGLTRERIDELTDICVDEISPRIPAFFSTARFEHMLARVRRVCKRSIWALSEHIKRGSFEPYGAEVSFGAGSPITGIEIALNGERKLLLTGRVDRVDIFDSGGNRYVKIIDYKSGSKKFSLGDVYFGMQLQLLLYMNALIKNGRELFGEGFKLEILPGGVFYFNIGDPVIEGQPGGEMEEALLKCFKMSGLALADKTVLEAMDGGVVGESSIIPVSVRKTDGGFGAASSVMGLGDFNKLRDETEKKAASIAEGILSGGIGAFPYKKGPESACGYCIFGAVCGFEADDRPDKFNTLRKGV